VVETGVQQEIFNKKMQSDPKKEKRKESFKEKERNSV